MLNRALLLLRTASISLILFSSTGAFAFAPAPATNRCRPWTKKRVNTPQSFHTTRIQQKPELAFDVTSVKQQPETSAVYGVGPLQVSLTSGDEELEEEETKVESWEADSKLVELVVLGVWGTAISAFILINNFIGPWPDFMSAVPERIWFVFHMLGGMLFGGGIFLTTAIEWLVAHNKNSPVLQFWFDKVPLLDAVIVLPALTVAMISGTGLSIEHYGGLGIAPMHIKIVFYTLVSFAAWWAVTDLTTQGKALTEVNEWAATAANGGNDDDVPDIVEFRKISNVVSCLFVLALYAIMVMKPGTLHY